MEELSFERLCQLCSAFFSGQLDIGSGGNLGSPTTSQPPTTTVATTILRNISNSYNHTSMLAPNNTSDIHDIAMF